VIETTNICPDQLFRGNPSDKLLQSTSSEAHHAFGAEFDADAPIHLPA